MAEIERERNNSFAPEGSLANSWAPGTWSVAGKLWLAFGLLVLVLALSSVVSYHSVQRIDRGLLRIVGVEEPLEQAVLEMEINAGETARAVLNYLRDLEAEHLAVMDDSEADFERYAEQFERLVETDEERRLGREVAGLYREFKSLGDGIVALADRRHGALEAFRRDVLEIDELIDEKLQKSIDMTTPDGMRKLLSALEMEINIDEAFAAIEGYVLRPDPALREEALDAEADFERFEALYRETGLAAEETDWLDRIYRNFAEAVTAGNEILAITDDLNTRLDQFEEHLETMDAILDDEIQPLIHAETVAAAADAEASTYKAFVYFLVLGIIALCIASVSARVIYRAIIGPVRVLVRGTEIVGAGNLDHRIDARSRDEFGHLAAAFNRMVENLGRARWSVEGARAQLEQRVAERTADLTNELAARERAQTALTNSEARFKGFAESASDWFWEMDAERRFTYASDRFFEVFGLPVEALIGKRWEDLVGAAQIATDYTNWHNYFDDLENHRPIRDFDHAIVGVDDVMRQISVSGLPMFDDAGKFLGYRGSGADVTAQRRIEGELRQAQKLEALGRLSGGIAHDFNNILLPIITITELTRDDLAQDKRLAANLDKVLMAAQRGRGLVEKILKFSRRQPMDRHPVDLAEVVEEALALVNAAVPATIEVRSDFEPGLGKVLADSTQIHEVIMNLTSNAAQSIGMKTGLIEITLREVRIDDADSGQLAELEPGLYAHMTISDTGGGMDAETMAQIFDPFFTTKSVGEGTGLGLAAVHGIVTEHGGAITVSSEPDQGTTFEIYLPLLEEGEAKPGDSATPWPLTGS